MSLAWKSLGHNQFESARWYKDGKEDFKFIRVSVASENQKRFSTVIMNLITQANSTILLTSYAYPYAVRQRIFYRNKWWEITNVGDRTLDVNPQAMSIVNPAVNMQYILEVIEVDEE